MIEKEQCTLIECLKFKHFNKTVSNSYIVHLLACMF